MKFTVVIPIYNGERFITRSINSVLNQTYRDIELILVNDGSLDNTESVIEDIKFNYSGDKVIKYKKIDNSGPSTARNCGIEMASGDYICFLDSDDEYAPNLFKELSQKIMGQDICYFGWEEQNEDTRLKFSEYTERFAFLKEDSDGVNAAKLKYNHKIWLCNCNEIYSMDLIRKNKIRYLDGVYSGEDSNFIYKCLINAKSVCALDKNYFINIYRNDSLMHSSFSKRVLTEFDAMKDLYDYTLKNTEDKDLKNMMFSLVYYSRIYISKRMAKSLKWYQWHQLRKMCKEYLPKISLERKLMLTKRQKLECKLLEISKPMFLIAVKLNEFRKNAKNKKQ